MWLGIDVELNLPTEEIIQSIQRVIPDIDFDPDMNSNSSSFAITILFPERPLDLIVVDYNILRLLKNSASYHSQKTAGLVFLAVLLAHELAHVLEFRNIRGGKLRSDGQPFQTPAGVTCREAGTAWEMRAFGGRMYPVCQPENSLANIRGLSIKSTAWNFDVMKANKTWIRQLFTGSYWTTTHLPLRPPIDKYARYALFEDGLIDSRYDISKQKERNDVRVETGSPRRRPRSTGPPKTCGGKRVWTGPQVASWIHDANPPPENNRHGESIGLQSQVPITQHIFPYPQTITKLGSTAVHEKLSRRGWKIGANQESEDLFLDLVEKFDQ